MKSAEMPSSPRPTAEEARCVFVNRLARLIQLQRSFEHDLNTTGARLLTHSILATYRDCIDFGAADRARTLMARAGLRLDGQRLERQ